ncbi:MAG TPA: SAM-dependent methyltransferase [Solibacterales bacterium]|nr:SAM-dependent methyltransferase [Bryobacterales bacterium]
MPDIAVAQTSFRDPDGEVLVLDDRVLRRVRRGEDLLAFLETPSCRRMMSEGWLTSCRKVGESAPGGELLFEHNRLFFPSYPQEWPPEMLHAAGRLTLEIAAEVAHDGFRLKDATPYNVLFDGTRPVFVDWLSFERRDARDPLWPCAAQFERTFLLPMMGARSGGLSPAEVFLARRDGLEPEDVLPRLGLLARWSPLALQLVTLPAMAKSRANESTYQPKRVEDAEQAAFVFRANLKRLSWALQKLEPGARASSWAGYMQGSHAVSYSGSQFDAKVQFVEEALFDVAPRRVLDVGCNTGHFSLLAARSGAKVVAIDYDAASVGETWRAAHQGNADVLPLVVNLARPTPALGWRYGENASFLDRARGRFDLVLMLAVIHHLLITERIPLEEVLGLLAEITTDAAIVEFVGAGDPMFQKLLRGRADLHRDLTVEAFEAACAKRFRIERKAAAPDADRTLYLLRK